MSPARKSKAIGRKTLTDYAALKTGIATQDCRAVINAALEGLVNEIANGRRVELRGLGAFKFRRNKGRLYASIKTQGDVVIEVPAHICVRFVPSLTLRSKVAALKIPTVKADSARPWVS